jgi:O-antigen ligase
MSRHSPNPAADPAATVSRSVERFLEILIVPVVGFVVVGRCLYGSGTGIDIWVLTLTVIYAILFLLGRSPAGPLTWVDWSLFAVVLAESVSYLNSKYAANSLHGYNETLFLFLFYCFVRLNLKREYQRVGIFLIITVFGLCLSATTLLSFARQYAEITAHGFGEVTNFRHAFRAFQTDSSPAGEWVTLYLALLPFPVLLFVRWSKAAPALSWLLLCPAVLILVAISATFSRGLYLAAASFFVSALLLFRLYRLPALNRVAGFGAAALLLLAAVLCLTPLRTPVLDTVSLFKTTSQVRSIEGRASLWKVSWEIAEDHPLLGVGAFNFPMHYAAYKGDDAVFVGRTFNIFLQLLVEKGALGLLAYCLLFFSFFKVSHESLRLHGGDAAQKAVTAVFVAACVALLVRDFSYSSVLTNQGVSTILWFVFAANAGAPTAPGDDAGAR